MLARCNAALRNQTLASGYGSKYLTVKPGRLQSTTYDGKRHMRSRNFRGNVFVGNLPPEFTDDELAETFDSFGIVLSASIARDQENGKRLRYGFVDIATERAANNAVAKMNGTQVHGFTLDVRISERKAAAKKPPRASPPRRRQPLRLVPSARAAADYASDDFYRPQPRKTPTFQVERRSLPRRY
jgi:RNA recognition motif-containing protein